MDFADVFEYGDEGAFGAMVAREREIVARKVKECAAAASGVGLVRLVAVGEAIGMAEEDLAEWRETAAASRRELSARYRELYSEYRMRSAVSPDAPETLSVLDEMVALGLEDNAYHKWALREQERVAAARERPEAAPAEEARKEEENVK